ncbi:hypothetical protein B0H16DRAFT_1893397 [Mycena metata]|uniref:Uncharacterized protein n=1 Tax=Mycena metata TaxID=1033252 RepID=A0AAD7MSH2_9AGAR|nr:hypothetical protein B0H16DRAFT_1893397 [Mycena metata]
MALLPQELLNAIVHHIDGVPTLKASCLAGSVFRDEAQRILFSKFKLDPVMRELNAVYGLLQNSPHIAPYITWLDIEFESSDSESGEILAGDSESLLKIFDRLKNVQSCTASFIPNGHIHAALLSAFLTFLSRQPLHKLHITYTPDLLPVVYLRLLTLAPTLSFLHVYLADDMDFPMPDWQNPVSRVRDLTLGSTSTGQTGLEALLVRSHFEKGTPGLLRLSLYCAHDLSSSLLFATMHTLEHVELNLQGALGSPIAIPPFPVLRSIKLSSLRLLDRYPLWFPDLILTILDRSPLLANLALVFTFSSRSDSTNPRHISAQLLTTLDTALVVHAAAPLLQWHILLRRPGQHTFTDFVTLVRRGMPRLDAQRRLTVEAPKSLRHSGVSDGWRYDGREDTNT